MDWNRVLKLEYVGESLEKNRPKLERKSKQQLIDLFEEVVQLLREAYCEVETLDRAYKSELEYRKDCQKRMFEK